MRTYTLIYTHTHTTTHVHQYTYILTRALARPRIHTLTHTRFLTATVPLVSVKNIWGGGCVALEHHAPPYFLCTTGIEQTPSTPRNTYHRSIVSYDQSSFDADISHYVAWYHGYSRNVYLPLLRNGNTTLQ